MKKRIKSRKGFTLMELMIVVAIIAIIAAITIPSLLRSRMTANEANAVSSTRIISTGELSYQIAAFQDADADGTGDFGSLTQLSDPDGGGLTPPYIDVLLGAGTKQGYLYAVVPVAGGPAQATAFTCVATPSSPGSTGYKRFFVDEGGVIRFTTDNSVPTIASTPLS